MRKYLAIAALGSLIVSGCSTYSLEKLRHTTPKGSVFQNALAKLYMDFADSEEQDYDWQNSWYFADKGLSAAYAKDVAPEELESWNLPEDKLADLEKARADLMKVITPDILARKPEIAARAQFNFDCWVEQQEENWQQDDIAACRDGFAKALAELGVNDKKKFKNTSSITVKKTENKTAPNTAPTTTSFMLLFEPKSVVFTAGADAVLGDITKTLAAQSDAGYEVVINDKSSGKKDNLELSMERFQAVKNKLLGAGIKESAIGIGGGSAKQTKRKIEIFLND